MTKWFQIYLDMLSGSQSIGVSASASVLPMNTQDWSPLGWTGWISLQSNGLKSLLQHHSSKASIPCPSAFFIVQLSHPYMTTGKIPGLIRWTFVSKVMSLLFNTLSSLVMAFFFWCWIWNSNTLATWCKELTHSKRPWCWERLKAGREEDDRGWDGWMASPTRRTWVWVSSRSWWWTGRPGVLQSMGSPRVGHDWATELNWMRHVMHLEQP